MMSPNVMTLTLGLTDDLAQVTLQLSKNGVPIGWIGLAGPQIETLQKELSKYRGLLKATEFKMGGQNGERH